MTDAAAACQAGHDLAAGRLCRAVLFHFGDGEPSRLAFSFHHLIVDGLSWSILLEDLETAYRQLAADRPTVRPIALAPTTSSYRQWAERLAAYASEPALLAQERFWTERIGRLGGTAPRLPVEGESAARNSVGSARELSVALSAEETRALLQEVPRAYRTRINEVLLAALVEAFAPWTGERKLLVELEGHGREELFAGLDVSRTFGWFTALYPACLDLTGTPADSPGEALKSVKEQLRAIPEQGTGFGVLRYLSSDSSGDAIRALPRPEVIFNYFGQLDQVVAAGRLFQPAVESPGPVRHPDQERLHLLEVSTRVLGGRLQIALTYSENRHRRATIEGLADRFAAALRGLIAHCLSPAAGGYTPADFPLARIDQPTLDRWAMPAVASPAEGRAILEDLYPASPVQEGMIFHSLQDPGSGVYMEQLSLELGGLDVAAFQRAFARLFERHAVLRTAFRRTADDRLLQVVRPAAPHWEERDLRSLSEPARRQAVAEYLEADRRRGFDLANPPLSRLSLLRTGEDTYRCVWTFHHALLDGWSLPPLLKEAFLLYAAALGGPEPRPEPPAAVPRLHRLVGDPAAGGGRGLLAAHAQGLHRADLARRRPHPAGVLRRSRAG